MTSVFLSLCNVGGLWSHRPQYCNKNWKSETSGKMWMFALQRQHSLCLTVRMSRYFSICWASCSFWFFVIVLCLLTIPRGIFSMQSVHPYQSVFLFSARWYFRIVSYCITVSSYSLPHCPSIINYDIQASDDGRRWSRAIRQVHYNIPAFYWWCRSFLYTGNAIMDLSGNHRTWHLAAIFVMHALLTAC